MIKHLELLLKIPNNTMVLELIVTLPIKMTWDKSGFLIMLTRNKTDGKLSIAYHAMLWMKKKNKSIFFQVNKRKINSLLLNLLPVFNINIITSWLTRKERKLLNSKDVLETKFMNKEDKPKCLDLSQLTIMVTPSLDKLLWSSTKLQEKI